MVEVTENGIAIFTFRHRAESQVYVVGDFNQWHKEHLPMRATADGMWQLMVHVRPGVYQFRYYCDGKWFTDFAAFGVTTNDFGDWNSLLYVPEEREEIPRRTPPVPGSRPTATPVAASLG
ncbi:MAG: glycogen-binding domain-containing protein [Planctomycetia bacterium]|nr:glycogen-binding domain-containing protein [Planctomycetia bacterium]